MAKWKISPPELGQLFYCDYDGPPGLPPEMTKGRKIVVISQQIANEHGTCFVVPFSTLHDGKSNPKWWVHLPLNHTPYLPQECWAKADMAGHVSINRLSPLRHQGKRVFPFLDPLKVSEIQHALAFLIGLDLTL